MFGSIPDWIIVIVAAILLFGGASRIPQLFKSFGRAMGEFKRGQMEVEKELKEELANNNKEEKQEKK